MAKKKPPLTPDESSKQDARPVRSADSDGRPTPKVPKASASRKPDKPPARRRAALDPGRTPGEEARALVDHALGLLDPKRRVALAREALELDPDCSDAYLLLADHAGGSKQVIALTALAVEAAARTLRPETFAEAVGSFWSLPETRPYMRARANLAEALWAAGERAGAAGHLRDLLRLNPGDNQGLRYTLANWLLNLDELDELDGLLARYDEDSTTWAYTRALAAFRREGDTPATRRLLRAAKKANKHVPDYLMGRKPLQADQPALYTPGDEDDAVLLVAAQLGAWKATAGALNWLRSQSKTSRKAAPKGRNSAGPSSTSRARLLRLPSEDDRWQVDYRQFARRIEVAGARVRPWMVLVSSETRDLVLAHALTDEAPSASALWKIVAGAMEHPAAGTPHRPTELVVRRGGEWGELLGHFEAIGIRCEPTGALEQVDMLFDDLTRHMAEAEPPGLLEMPGMTPAQVARFYEEAAEFYRRAPWRSLGFEAVIRVECDRYQSGPWHAVIMGQSGLTLGLALYEDLELLRTMWAGQLSDDEGARRTVALTVTYDDESSLPDVDLDAIERNAFAVAAPEAYPSAFRKEMGLSMRPPLAWELDLLTACLAAFPEFVARHPADDTTRKAFRADVGSGPLEIGLSWVEDPA